MKSELSNGRDRSDPLSSDGFIGRGWLVEAISLWLETDGRFLFLTGPPGAGKSALVSYAAEELDVGEALYRCRAVERATCDPIRFVESLAEQFSESVPGFATALADVATEHSGRAGELRISGRASVGTAHADATVIGVRVSLSNASVDEALERLVRRPLERVAMDQPPLVLVDALDEALTYRGQRTIAEIVLDPGVELPLRFVVSSRLDPRITAALASLPAAAAIDLVADAPDHHADVAEYAAHRLRTTVPDVAQRNGYAEKLAEQAAGNYLYVYHLTEDILRGERSPENLLEPGSLPTGLEGLYREFISREIRRAGNIEGEERWQREIRPLLAVLVSAQGNGFTVAQLAEVLGTSELAVRDVVQVLGQYLVGGPDGPWSVYHRSFVEFLLGGSPPLLDPAEGHKRIALHASSRWGEAWNRCPDSYFLLHLPDHLALAADASNSPGSQVRELRDLLFDLARSDAFLKAQEKCAPDRDPQLSTLNLALRSSLAEDAYERVVPLAISLARARAAADSVTPIQAAHEWGLQASSAKAHTYPAGISSLWHLMTLASFGALARQDDFVRTIEVIEAAALEKVDPEWSGLAAALVAPIMPAVGEEHLETILRLADDEMLSYLAAFVLEGPHPGWAIAPALWIDEDVLRARAGAEILSRLAFAGGHREALPRYGDWVVQSFERREKRLRQSVGDEDEDEGLPTYVLLPDVPDSLLVAEAARGNLGSAREKFTEKPVSLSVEGQMLALVVEALVDDRSVDAVRKQVKEAFDSLHDPWTALHYARYLAAREEPDAGEQLDLAIQLAQDEEEFEYGMYDGHVDPFHGRCDVGLKLSLVQALCAQGRIADARDEVESMQKAAVPERIRALSYIAQAEQADDGEDAVREAAELAAANPDPERLSRVMLLLADDDFGALLDVATEALTRTRDDALWTGASVRAVLAWSAARRGDQVASRSLATEVERSLTGASEWDRSDERMELVAAALLRARQVDAAVAVVGATVHNPLWRGRWTQRSLADRLARNDEMGEAELLLKATGAELSVVPDPAAIGEIVSEELRRLEADRDPDSLSEWFLAGAAANLAVLAAGAGDAQACAAALEKVAQLDADEDMRSMGWDAFRGHFPRSDEIHRDENLRRHRFAYLHVELSEAFHRSGLMASARSSFEIAEKQILGIDDGQMKSRMQSRLALTAVRCDWYADLSPLWQKAAQIQGCRLGHVAEELVLKVDAGGDSASSAKTALSEIITSSEFTNVDSLEVISYLAIPAGDAAVDAALIDAIGGRLD